MNSVCVTKDTPVLSLSSSSLQGSSLSTFTSSNQPQSRQAGGHLHPYWDSLCSRLFWVRWPTPGDIRLWHWSLPLSAPPLGAISLSFTLDSFMRNFMIISHILSAPRLLLNQRPQVPRIHHSCDGDQMMAVSASVPSCYLLVYLDTELRTSSGSPSVSHQTH